MPPPFDSTLNFLQLEFTTPGAAEVSKVTTATVDLLEGHARLQDGVVGPSGDIVSGLLQAYSLQFPAFGPMTVRLGGLGVAFTSAQGVLTEAAFVHDSSSVFRARFATGAVHGALFRTGSSSIRLVRETGGGGGGGQKQLDFALLAGTIDTSASFDSSGRALNGRVTLKPVSGELRIRFDEGRSFLTFSASHLGQIQIFEKRGQFATVIIPNLRQAGIAIDVSFVNAP